MRKLKVLGLACLFVFIALCILGLLAVFGEPAAITMLGIVVFSVCVFIANEII